MQIEYVLELIAEGVNSCDETLVNSRLSEFYGVTTVAGLDSLIDAWCGTFPYAEGSIRSSSVLVERRTVLGGA